VALDDLERRNSPYFALFHRIQVSKLLFFIFKQQENVITATATSEQNCRGLDLCNRWWLERRSSGYTSTWPDHILGRVEGQTTSSPILIPSRNGRRRSRRPTRKHQRSRASLWNKWSAGTNVQLANWLIYAQAFVAGLHPLAATHFGARLGAFFHSTGCFENNVLFDNTALEIRVRI